MSSTIAARWRRVVEVAADVAAGAADDLRGVRCPLARVVVGDDRLRAGGGGRLVGERDAARRGSRMAIRAKIVFTEGKVARGRLPEEPPALAVLTGSPEP